MAEAMSRLRESLYFYVHPVLPGQDEPADQLAQLLQVGGGVDAGDKQVVTVFGLVGEDVPGHSAPPCPRSAERPGEWWGTKRVLDSRGDAGGHGRPKLLGPHPGGVPWPRMSRSPAGVTPIAA